MVQHERRVLAAAPRVLPEMKRQKAASAEAVYLARQKHFWRRVTRPATQKD